MADEILAEAKSQITWFHKGPLPAKTTPLMMVVIVKGDPREVFTVLQEPDVRRTIDEQNSEGMTALMYAIQKAKIDIALELINAGAKVGLKNKAGKSASDMLNELSLEEFNEDEQTALHLREQIVNAMKGKGGKRKRFSTKRKNKRNVRARVRYSRRRT